MVSARQRDRLAESSGAAWVLDDSGSAQTVFQGVLDDMPVVSLLQSLQINRKSASIRIRTPRQRGKIWVVDGEPAHASYGSAVGSEALYRMLAEEEGNFRVNFGSPEAVQRTIDAPLPGLLLEGARRVDHIAQLVGRLPPATKALGTASAELVDLTNEELDILAACNGKRTLDEIVEQSANALATLEAAAKLWKAGAISVLEIEVPRRPDPRAFTPEPGPPMRVPVLKDDSTPRLAGPQPVAMPPEARGGRSRMSAAGFLVAVGLVSGGVAFAVPLAEEAEEPVTQVTAAPVAATPAVAAAPSCAPGMVYVPGGDFTVGSDSKSPVLANALPTRDEQVGEFCIDITEVTVEAYRACVTQKACAPAHRDSQWPRAKERAWDWERSKRVYSALCNEGAGERGSHPVNCVTWGQANAYCGWAGKRLPGEIEWEFAARGTESRRYPWGAMAPTAASGNFCGQECRQWRERRGLSGGSAMYDQNDGFPGTAPVGSFPEGSSPFGVQDMAGNVFEWTADQMDTGPGTADAYIIRGGAFNSFMPQFADAALRFPQEVDAHPHGIGFRCAASTDAG